MRVLHLIHAFSPRSGGPYAALGGFVEAGRRVGVESEVLTTDVAGRERTGWARDVPVHFAVSLPAGPALAPGLVGELRRRARDFDVLHVHGLWRFHGVAAARASRRYGVPMIVRTCGHLAPRTFGRRSGRKRLYFALIERRVLRRAALLHFTTPAEQAASRPWTGDAEAVVLPPPVAELDLPPRPLARERLGLAAEARIVLCVARLDPIKRHDLLLEALLRLPAGVTMACVGPDPGGREAKLRRLAAELGVESRVRFPGLVDREGLSNWLAASDAFASASEHENFGISIAEAAMAGLPLVVPDDLQIARDLQGPAVAVRRDPAALGDGLRGLLEAHADRARGRALRERAVSLWSPAAIGGRLLEAYRGVKAPSRPGARAR